MSPHRPGNDRLNDADWVVLALIFPLFHLQYLRWWVDERARVHPSPPSTDWLSAPLHRVADETAELLLEREFSSAPARARGSVTELQVEASPD
ncbi:unnamed protein product [Pleuronectes platessa]|uniref:Uncharacterized protein n=1 Tax=Pleuronectes platessa TaxID=8262 RepID=A0A9N7UU12_PLEPL|nr:unnamed protein product [Pleuronectes platessa]